MRVHQWDGRWGVFLLALTVLGGVGTVRVKTILTVVVR